MSSGLLALAFATKETIFILVAILGLFLTLLLTARNLPAVAARIDSIGMSPARALGRVVSELANAARGVDLARMSRPASVLILLITLTLPQWSAFVSLFPRLRRRRRLPRPQPSRSHPH